MTLWTVCASCLSIFPTPRICRKSTVCSIGMFCCWQLLPVLKFEFSTTNMPIEHTVFFLHMRGSASVPNFFFCQAESGVEVLSRRGQTAVKFIDMTLLLNWHCVRPTTFLYTFLVIKQKGWEYANWNSKIIIMLYIIGRSKLTLFLLNGKYRRSSFNTVLLSHGILSRTNSI